MRTLMPGALVSLLGVLGACAGVRPYRTVTLDYSRGPGTDQCADSKKLQKLVRQTLGYDPFRENAPWTLDTEITRAADRLVGRVRVTDSMGRELGQREISAQHSSCEALVQSLALAISVAVDPEAGTEVRKRPPSRPPPQLPIGAGGLAAFGASPKTTGGGTVALALRWPRLSLELMGRADVPTYADLPGDARLGVSLAGATIAACGHYSVAFGCATFTADAALGHAAGLINARRSTLPYFGPGARLGVELPVWKRVLIRTFGELIIPIGEVQFMDDPRSTQLWSSPSVSAAIHLGVMVNLGRDSR